MNKINLEFTSTQAGVLIPFINSDICYLHEWAERICSEVDAKEVKFLDSALNLLHDGSTMDLDVVIIVPEQFRNTLIRLAVSLVMAREKTRASEDYNMYDRIIEKICKGYQMLGAEV